MNSGSACSNFFYVTLSFQKDCDKFKFILAVRFFTANKRQSVERTVYANSVENLHITFDKGVTFNNNFYSNFKYGGSKELTLMSQSTSASFIDKLQNYVECRKLPCLYSDLNNCHICAPPLVNHQGNCIDTCPDNYFKNKGKCAPCATECKTCNGPLNGNCLTCVIGLLNNGNSCVPRCPDNMAPNKQGKCVKCDEKCVICRDADTCSKCDSDNFLKDGNCVSKCGDTFYKSFNPNICLKCSTGCQECASRKKCDVCEQGFLMKQGTCVRTCGDKFFVNVSTATCNPCHNGCVVCSDFKTCKTCENGFRLSNKRNVCLPICNKGMVLIDGACQPCDDKVNCSICKPSNKKECTKCNDEFFLKAGKCILFCGDGFYADSNKSCKQCQAKECKICTNEKCLQCLNNKVVFRDIECLTNCVDGYIRSGNVCVKCNNSSCKKCKENELSTCTHCYPPRALFNGKCLDECPAKFFKQGNQCEPCIKGCDKCKNNSSCNVCSDDFFLKNNACVDCCGVGFTEAGKVCKPCMVYDCDSCNPFNLNICEKCISPKYLFNNKCSKVCPIGTFPNTIGGCGECKHDCAVCQTKETCDSCKNGKVLQRHNCQSLCNDGYIPVNNICTSCNNLRCKKCDVNLTLCTE